jgi:hypothetical protein
MDKEICTAIKKIFLTVISGLENISQKSTVSDKVGQGNIYL